MATLLRATPHILSLGAGVQSTTLLMLAAEKRIPRYDYAIFADTGWEPTKVYQHLDRLEREVARPAGIPILRVSVGNIRQDALNPEHHFASMPLYVRNPDGTRGIGRRQCTAEYKIRPIQEQVRYLLGAKTKENGRPGRVKRDRYVTQSIGISRDEITRARDSHTGYARHDFPLLDLPGAADGREGWMRSDCRRYLRRTGFGDTPKSACIGCPFRRNASWRHLRDTDPDSFADACEFDRQIRHGHPHSDSTGKALRGRYYLHESRTPLADAPIEHVTRVEWANRQMNLFDSWADTQAGLDDGGRDEPDPDITEDYDPDAETGCSPFACPGSLAV